MNVALNILGHLFTFVAAIAGILLGLSFTRGQRERFPVLRKLDGKQIHLGVTAVLSLAVVLVTDVTKDVQTEFEPVPGVPGMQKATESGFEKELKDAADELKAKAKRYFEAGEEDFKPGSYEDAARNYQKSIDLLPTMSAYLNAGISWDYVSNYPEAEQAFLAGLQLARKKRSEIFEGIFLGNIGLVEFQQGLLDEALMSHQQSLEINRKICNTLGQAQDIGNIAVVYISQGKMDEALKLLQQSLDIFSRIKNLPGQGNQLGNIGLVYFNQGKFEMALRAYNQSLEIDKKIGDLVGQAQTLGNIGLVYYERGLLDEALRFHQQSLEINQRISNPLGQAQDLGNIGNVYFSQGKLEKALRFHQQARDIFCQIGAGIQLQIAEKNIQSIFEQLQSSKNR